MKQIDILGNEIDVADMPEPIKRGKKKTATMQERYGTLDGKTCKTCKYNVRDRRDRKSWHKCLLWLEFFKGHSEASDIRNKDIACKKWESECEK